MAVLTCPSNDYDEMFVCECSSIEHSMQLSYWKPMDGDENVIFLDRHVCNWRTFWQRTLVSLKFCLLNKQPDNGIFCPITFRQKDMGRFIQILSHQTTGVDDKCASVTIPSDGNDYETKFSHEIIAFYTNDSMSEFSSDVFFKQNLGFFKRLWRGIRYISGYRSRYGNTDSYSITEEAAKGLKHLAIKHRDYGENECHNTTSSTTQAQ